jgi:hypothetical protein
MQRLDVIASLSNKASFIEKIMHQQQYPISWSCRHNFSVGSSILHGVVEHCHCHLKVEAREQHALAKKEKKSRRENNMPWLHGARADEGTSSKPMCT